MRRCSLGGERARLKSVILKRGETLPKTHVERSIIRFTIIVCTDENRDLCTLTCITNEFSSLSSDISRDRWITYVDRCVILTIEYRIGIRETGKKSRQEYYLLSVIPCRSRQKRSSVNASIYARISF